MTIQPLIRQTQEKNIPYAHPSSFWVLVHYVQLSTVLVNSWQNLHFVLSREAGQTVNFVSFFSDVIGKMSSDLSAIVCLV